MINRLKNWKWRLLKAFEHSLYRGKSPSENSLLFGLENQIEGENSHMNCRRSSIMFPNKVHQPSLHESSDASPITISCYRGSEATLARYPFLPQASAWMSSLAQKHHIDLEELIEGSILENARKGLE